MAGQSYGFYHGLFLLLALFLCLLFGSNVGGGSVEGDGDGKGTWDSDGSGGGTWDSDGSVKDDGGGSGGEGVGGVGNGSGAIC